MDMGGPELGLIMAPALLTVGTGIYDSVSPSVTGKG